MEIMDISIKKQLFGDLDFSTLKNDSTFLEDSVREVIILPLLKQLGYDNKNIVRSLHLLHPYYKTGSRKKNKITLIPDYVLKSENNYAWVLDAKAPSEKIINDDNVLQVYSYASHKEICSTYFALCNGLEFALYRTFKENDPILFFQLEEIDYYFEELKKYLKN